MTKVNTKKRSGVSALFKTIAVAAVAFKADLACALPMIGPGAKTKSLG